MAEIESGRHVERIRRRCEPDSHFRCFRQQHGSGRSEGRRGSRAVLMDRPSDFACWFVRSNMSIVATLHNWLEQTPFLCPYCEIEDPHESTRVRVRYL